ncbi:MAG: SsrA-binding protein SmpB [Phycisphaerales bacterium]|nr:SsrA-binding protein SmpB [Phycisphaerales bacterium]
MAKHKKTTNEPTIENRKARHNYLIVDTLECGIKLLGTEVKSVRDGQASLGEGFVRAAADPWTLTLHGVHIAEYPPAAGHNHDPVRARVLLAHGREIRKLLIRLREKGTTLVPLKLYFKGGRAKLLIGFARGKSRSDKRQDLAKRDAQREIDRALS